MKLIKMDFGIVRKFDRHLRIQLRHLTLRKSINVISAMVNYLFNKRKIASRPFLLKVESSSFCNLQCLGCRTDKSEEFKDGTMSLERYKSVIDELGKELIEVVLYL